MHLRLMAACGVFGLWLLTAAQSGATGAASGSAVGSTPSNTAPRARDLGVPFDGTPGPSNAITDVAGIEVGYKTLISGEGRLIVGKGPVRTGVTRYSSASQAGYAKRLCRVFRREWQWRYDRRALD